MPGFHVLENLFFMEERNLYFDRYNLALSSL